jgi:WD40 repeat protein
MRKLLLSGLLLCAIAACAQNPIKLNLPCQYRSQRIAPSGKYVAVRCTDRSVHLLQVPSGEKIASFAAKHRYDNFDFSADSNWFGAAGLDGNVEVISLKAPATRKTWIAGKGTFDVLTFVTNNLIAVSSHSAPGALWDISGEPKRVATLDTDFDGLTAAAASPDGQWLVTAGSDTVLRFYRAPDWKMSGEYRGLTLEPFAVTFTLDGKFAVMGGADRQVTLLDPVTAKVAKAFPAENDPIDQVTSLDKDRLAVLYFDADGHKSRHLEILDLPSGSSKTLVVDPTVTGGGIVEGHVWLAHGDGNSLTYTVGL